MKWGKGFVFASLRAVVLLFLTLIFLYSFYKKGIISAQELYLHAKNKVPELLLLGLFSIASLVLVSLRYHVLVSKGGSRKIPLRLSMGLTFEATAIGQWLPGSMAFVEAFRVRLSEKSMGTHLGHLFKVRVLALSVLDRVIGLYAMFFTGAICSVTLIVFESGGHAWTWLYLAIHCLSLLGFVAASQILSGEQIWARKIRKKIYAMGRQTQLRMRTVRLILRQKPVLLLCLGISLASNLCIGMSFHVASQIQGEDYGVVAWCVAIPLMTLSQLLPLGMAGVGGFQFLNALLYAGLGFAQAATITITLAQKTVELLCFGVVGFCAHLFRRFSRPRQPI